MNEAVAKKVHNFFRPYKKIEAEKGYILIFADNEPPGIFYLESGQIRQYDINSQGVEVVINVFKPSAFFPMSWAINKTPNKFFFDAALPSVLRQAPAEDALKFIRANPDVAFDLLKRVYSGTDGLLRRTAHLMGGTARSRLIFELIVECRRFGKFHKDGSCTIHISETELGTRAGLARETVSREIKELKMLNLITVNRQGVAVKNFEQLEKELGSEL